MKNKKPSKDYIVYGFSLLATCATLLLLDIKFDCPLTISFLPIMGAHALAYAALKILPHYTFWMPPLTALYLSGWYWMGTYVEPHFMAAADKTPDLGSTTAFTALWITTLLFCGVAGVIFLVKKLLDGSALPDASPAEKPTKHPFKIHMAARVTVCGLSAAVVITSALCAYLYREEKVEKLTAELTRPADYTVIFPNLRGKTDPDVPDYTEKTVDIINYRVAYQKIQETSPKDLINATQSYLYGKGDLTVATVVLRHKDSTLDPVRDYAVSDVTLTYTNDLGGTTQTVVVTQALRQQVMDIMGGKPAFVTETPDGLGRGEYPYSHSAYVTVSFADHPEISWRAHVSFTEEGEWYLAVYSVPEDFDLKGSWDLALVYYPLGEEWKALIGES